jgi:hypothetical protein
MMDRDTMNNVALNLTNAGKNTKVTVISCFSHGRANIGYKFKMGESDLVLKSITKMVQFRLCKARSFFRTTFDEEAEKGWLSMVHILGK